MSAPLPGHAAPDAHLPLLIEVFPQVTQVVADILVRLDEPELAERLLRQRFYGPCNCRPDCRFILTAPAGSSGTQMIWLEEVPGEIVGEMSLDPTCEFVTDFYISDRDAAGIPPDWLEAGDSPA